MLAICSSLLPTCPLQHLALIAVWLNLGLLAAGLQSMLDTPFDPVKTTSSEGESATTHVDTHAQGDETNIDMSDVTGFLTGAVPNVVGHHRQHSPPCLIAAIGKAA
jgi:hypothetical protein